MPALSRARCRWAGISWSASALTATYYTDTRRIWFLDERLGCRAYI